MFNFTTQSVYNQITDFTVNAKGVNVPKDANLILNTIQKVNPTLRIGNTRFTAADVVDIHVKNPSLESLAEVTFDMEKLLEKVDEKDITARFVLYVGLSMNAQDAFYANDYVYKGKPLTIEFPVKVGDDGDKLVKRIAKIAKKYILLSMGTEEIIRIETADAQSASGNEGDPGYVPATSASITFKGVNGYQQIKKAVLQYFDPEAKTVDCCTKDGDYIDLITGVPVIYEISTTGENKGKAVAVIENEKEQKLTEEGKEALGDDEVAILPGLEAFGDYNWILHNLRLPTAANYYPWSPANRMGENPVPGQDYTQFIVRIQKERDGIMGEIVGARGVSVTTHVLYVAGNAAKDTSVTATPADKVYKAFNTLLGNEATNKIKTVAEDALAEPYQNA